jgi:radical SAM family uncharacterized protein/radical SAM-linked protein
MQHVLEEKFFPFVIKPGQYTGGELGQIIKSHEGRLKFALGYPDKYEIGMSYLGTQILYHLINGDDRFLCERFFAYDTDAEAVMRRERIAAFTLESHRPLAEFDIVGFTLAYEMVYTNLLNILDLAGIPLRSRDRGHHHPLIIAGGPVVNNPEPSAEFIDLFYIGDAEDNIIRICEIVHESKNLTRPEKLRRLAREVASVYVPAFYDPITKKPVHDDIPAVIKNNKIPNLERRIYPDLPIVPFIETVHSRLTVEIMRGCPWNCRFCQACAVYRPVRVRPAYDIISQVNTGLRKTGFDEVSLLSLSSGDYPEIETLTLKLSRELQGKRVALALPSMRPGTFTQELAAAAKTSRKTGLTFAPEAGTERLRAFIRKNITDRALYDTIELAFRNDWNLVKLYFMVGLPTESDEDIDGIVDMIHKICRIAANYKGRRIINVTLSPFSPKPHTPLQWDAQPHPEEIARKIEHIKRSVRNSFVNFKEHDNRLAFMEGIIGRSDRSMADVIEAAFKAGARFDGWSENFNFDLWMKAFQTCGIDPYSLLRERSFSENLPWEHIELAVSNEHLKKQRGLSSEILKDPHAPKIKSEPGNSMVDDNTAFGRSTKKVVKVSAVAPTKNFVRIKWGRRGLTRFLSHLDNIRTIERAIRRASIPVAYSLGFHPHMKLSFGPSLSLGCSSEAEYFDMTLESPFRADIVARLNKDLPEGFYVASARVLFNDKVSLNSRINRAVYDVEIERQDNTQSLLDELSGRDKIEIKREKKDGIAVVDIRPAIYELTYSDENNNNPGKGVITMTLGIGTGGYARPNEVILAAGLKDAVGASALFVHRRALLHEDQNGVRRDPMEF